MKGKLTETLAAVNKELKSIFLPAMEDELILYRSRDEIIFPVNLLEPNDNDKIVLQQIRQKISDAHKVEKAEIPLIPSLLSCLNKMQSSIALTKSRGT